MEKTHKESTRCPCMSFFKCFCLLGCCILPYIFLPVFASIQFCLFLLFAVSTASLADCLFLCLYLSLIFFSPLWTWSNQCCVRLCVTTFYFFFCAPLPPSVPSPSSSLPVLIWKCFGLQRMMVDIKDIKTTLWSDERPVQIAIQTTK